MIFGIQLCKWILIILVNLLRCVACTSLTWWRNVDVTEIMPFTVHVTLSPCCRMRRQEFIPSWMWPSNLPDLNPVDYSIWGILPERSMMWRSWMNVCGGSGGCWTTPSSRQRLCSGDCGVVVWMHVLAWIVDICNINFELWLSAVFRLFHRYWFP